jgi:hypothetical protein
MNIVGISGKKQSGKDTFAKYLINNLGYTKVSFAEPIKKYLYILNPLVVANDGFTTFRYQTLIDTYGDDIAKEKFKEVRRLQQVFGTEVVRDNLGQDFWIDLAFKKIEEQKLEKVVITDIRFPNETLAINREMGLLIKIKSNRLQHNDKHASEQDLPDYHFDRIVENNRSLEEYEETIKSVCKELKL